MLSRYAIHYYDWANTVGSRIEDLQRREMSFGWGMVSRREASTSKNGEGLKGNAREDHQFIVIKVFLRTGRLFSPLSG